MLNGQESEVELNRRADTTSLGHCEDCVVRAKGFSGESQEYLGVAITLPYVYIPGILYKGHSWSGRFSLPADLSQAREWMSFQCCHLPSS